MRNYLYGMSHVAQCTTNQFRQKTIFTILAEKMKNGDRAFVFFLFISILILIKAMFKMGKLFKTLKM